MSSDHNKEVKAKPNVGGLMQATKENALKTEKFRSAVDNSEGVVLQLEKEEDDLQSHHGIRRKRKKSAKDQLAIQKAI